MNAQGNDRLGVKAYPLIRFNYLVSYFEIILNSCFIMCSNEIEPSFSKKYGVFTFGS